MLFRRLLIFKDEKFLNDDYKEKKILTDKNKFTQIKIGSEK